MINVACRIAVLIIAPLFCLSLASSETVDHLTPRPSVALLTAPTNSLGMRMNLIRMENQSNSTLTTFYISDEITVEQWDKVMGDASQSKAGTDLPIKKISRRNAEKFCNKLIMMDGRYYRLPTTAELEVLNSGNQIDNNVGLRVVCPIKFNRNTDTTQINCAHLFFDEDIKIISKPERPYPPQRANRIFHEEFYASPGSLVFVEAVVGIDGLPKSVRYIGGTTVFEKSAIEYLKQWKFESAKIDGQAVEASKIFTVTFRKKRYFEVGEEESLYPVSHSSTSSPHRIMHTKFVY